MRRTKIEKNILFLCEDNACLSLMAESMAKHRRLPKIRIFSAGIRPGQDTSRGTPGIARNRRRTVREHDQKRGSSTFQGNRSGGFL